jgi:hypothetical protein
MGILEGQQTAISAIIYIARPGVARHAIARLHNPMIAMFLDVTSDCVGMSIITVLRMCRNNKYTIDDRPSTSSIGPRTVYGFAVAND